MARGGKWWRRDYKIPKHSSALVRQFFEILNTEKIPAPEVAQKAGAGSHTIAEWGRRTNPTLPLFEAAVNALGYELKIVKRDQR